MATSILTADGQVTIPEEILRRLNLRVGDQLDFEVTAGAFIVRPQREATGRPSRVFGLLRHLAKETPVSFEEMNQAVLDGASERFRKATR